MEGGVDDNNVNVDDDVCGENNKGESDCGEGENKDEVGDDDEDMGEHDVVAANHNHSDKQ